MSRTPVKRETIGDVLFWSYANLAMAHAAVTDRAARYGPKHYMIRTRLLAGLRSGSMNVRTLADDERLKLVLPQACAYCTSRERLSVDHLIARFRGGEDAGENMVWACRSCNSSKGAKDVLVWLDQRGEFPPLLLLRRYLKLAIEYCTENSLLAERVENESGLPFSINAVPVTFPAPSSLVLWRGFDEGIA